MTLRKEIHEAAIIPTGYGVAYWRWDATIAVCYPVPFNVVVSLARRFWYALKRFGGDDREIRAYVQGEAHGREMACEARYHEGYIAGGRDMEQAIRASIREALSSPGQTRH